MKRVSDDTVEFTHDELIIREIHDLLLDQGYDQGTATDMIFGCEVPIYLRSKTPTLDKVMQDVDFIAYLRM
jgi:hypothetical protein